MDAVQKRSRRFRRRVEAFLYLGIFLAMAGGFGLLYIHNTVDSLEQEYKQERASQFRSHIMPSRDHHPHNQYLPWGPQVVTSGYSGRDNRDVYDDQIELYKFFQPHARLSLIAGLSVTLLAGIVLIVDLALRTIKRRQFGTTMGRCSGQSNTNGAKIARSCPPPGSGNHPAAARKAPK